MGVPSQGSQHAAQELGQGSTDEARLCLVFLPDGSWWVTCMLVNPLLLLSIFFPSLGSEVQAPHMSKLVLAPYSALQPYKKAVPQHTSLQTHSLHRGAAWCPLPAIPSKVYTHPAAQPCQLCSSSLTPIGGQGECSWGSGGHTNLASLMSLSYSSTVNLINDG